MKKQILILPIIFLSACAKDTLQSNSYDKKDNRYCSDSYVSDHNKIVKLVKSFSANMSSFSIVIEAQTKCEIFKKSHSKEVTCLAYVEGIEKEVSAKDTYEICDQIDELIQDKSI